MNKGNTTYRFAVGIALAAAFILVWLSLGVGIIGRDGDPANVMYFGVLAVGIIGALIARFRPRGMARARGCISLTIFIGLLLLNPMFLELGRLDVFVISVAAYAQCEADLSNCNVGVFRHCLSLPNHCRVHFLGSATQPAPGERQRLIHRGCAAQSTCAQTSASAPKI